MASKAEKLKQGARKTGRGLFKDMERLNSAVEAEEQEESVTSDIDENPIMTEEVNEIDDDNSEADSAETQTVVATAPVENKKEPTIYTDDDSKSRRPDEDIKIEKTEEKAVESEVLQEILKGVTEPVEEKNAVEDHRAETALEDSTDFRVNTDNATEDDEELSVLTENIKGGINTEETKVSRPARKQNSRYEKDKFLLLDIRGYRDYIEHIAKAANMSATKYIRNLIEQDMEKNKDIYIAHKKLEEMLRNKAGN